MYALFLSAVNIRMFHFLNRKMATGEREVKRESMEEEKPDKPGPSGVATTTAATQTDEVQPTKRRGENQGCPCACAGEEGRRRPRRSIMYFEYS